MDIPNNIEAQLSLSDEEMQKLSPEELKRLTALMTNRIGGLFSADEEVDEAADAEVAAPIELRRLQAFRRERDRADAIMDMLIANNKEEVDQRANMFDEPEQMRAGNAYARRANERSTAITQAGLDEVMAAVNRSGAANVTGVFLAMGGNGNDGDDGEELLVISGGSVGNGEGLARADGAETPPNEK